MPQDDTPVGTDAFVQCALAKDTPLCLSTASPHPSFFGESEAGAVDHHSGGSRFPLSAVVGRDNLNVGGAALGGQ